MRVPVPEWWARRSLRLKLTAAAALMIAAALVGAASLLVVWLRASLVSGLDQTAFQQAQVIAANQEDGDLPRILPLSGEGDTAVQVVDGAGAVRSSSANVADERRLFTFAPSTSAAPQVHTVHDVPLDGAETWRAVAMPARTDGQPRTVYVAVPTAPVDRNLAALTAGLAIAVPPAVALLTAVVWLLTGRALRPVDALRGQTAEITTCDLGRRLDVPPAEDALGRLARTLNDLLARLDVATRQQRQFVADAAHELRSPLSSLHTQLEVAVRHPGSAAWETRGPALIEESERLSRLVDDLLRLARLDARPKLRKRPVDLDEIVFDEVCHARLHTPLLIDRHAVGAARVYGDEDALARVVRNLLDNSIRYAVDRIDVSLRVRDGTACLVVADDGPGIPAADRRRVFDRFTRLDGARARDTGGSGLGLAIVHDIVAAHNGRVDIEDNAPGARIVVHVPATDL
ncbi:sensor histidine kinase [Streptomyces glomeratus]|uniref:histidine kinase n=1 Tax=Streptomyces glomeratus TaxID=284452 RepID=A0ABP6LN32_9ACTN|nr:ATP-binding protein [Streptomyces glomeratus]MCF1510693.1 HAMP domain-containing histidine kinase [Streptomyces glomeratus]